MFNNAFATAAGNGLPIAATEIAHRWDDLYMFLLYLSIFFFIATVGAMLYFGFKYKDRAGLKTKYITHSTKLEVIFTVIPTALLMVIFAWGWSVYKEMISSPPGAMEIRVIGKQWLWQFQYDDGRVLTGEVFVPVGKPVKFVMTSQDVLHSMFIPDFRVKQDVVDGTFSSVWFETTVPGKHQIFCTEYCGTSHSGMLAKLYALNEKEWNEFMLKDKHPMIAENDAGDAKASTGASASGSAMGGGTLQSAGSLEVQGKALYQKYACATCHNSDGAKGGVGPTFKGIYGQDVAVIEDGAEKTVKVDDNYIKESIEYPAKKVVKGFNPVMPVFKGQIKDTEINAIISYIRSLK